MSLILVAGYTGSGKTEILEHLQLKGQQVLNLEEIAAHNGSVFGHIPHNKAFTSYAFQKALLSKWSSFDLSKPVYCEAKSPTIGKLQIPSWLFQLMNKAMVVWLDTAKEIRLQRLLTTYGSVDLLSFIQALSKLSDKISKDLLEQMYCCFQAGKRDVAFSMLMEYYDKALYYNKTQYAIIQEIEIIKWEPLIHASEIIDVMERHLLHEAFAL